MAPACPLRTQYHSIPLQLAALRRDSTTGCPILIHDDKNAAIQTLRRRVISGRMRHVRVALSFILRAVELGHVSVHFCPFSLQLADFLTKSLGKIAFGAAMALLRGLPSEHRLLAV